MTVVMPWEGDLVELDDIEEAIWTPVSEGNGHAPHALDEGGVEYTVGASRIFPTLSKNGSRWPPEMRPARGPRHR